MPVLNTKHLFYELTCECDHCTREVPHRCEDDVLWEHVQFRVLENPRWPLTNKEGNGRYAIGPSCVG
jgi:hypothetical protein